MITFTERQINTILEIVPEVQNIDSAKKLYLTRYVPHLEKFLSLENKKLLEFGIDKGGSLYFWASLFPTWHIYGVDIKPPEIVEPRIHIYQGKQQDSKLLQSLPGPFDIIIDDASHVGSLTAFTFSKMWDRLNSGGLYVIEDWGTGYWEDWEDGKSWKGTKELEQSLLFKATAFVLRKLNLKVPTPQHSYGMVGFIKQLVDLAGAEDISRGSFKGTATEVSEIDQIIIEPSIVFIKKK